MAALTLAGVDVPVASASRPADETIGSLSRSLSGADQDGIRSRKRAQSFTTTPMLRTNAEALRTTLKGAAFTAAGDLVEGGSMTAFGELDAAVVVSHWDGGSWVTNSEVLTFTLREA